MSTPDEVLGAPGVTMTAAPDRRASVPGNGRLTARNRTVERHLSLAMAVARRYRGRGIPLEDLVQVASVGLIKAVDRYDPARNVDFKRFAVPTMAGEIKRHFRDQGWQVRVPRRLQNLGIRARQAGPDLAQTLGRSPTAADIAAHLGETEADVVLALGVVDAYRPLSIDAPIAPGHGANLGSTLDGGLDPGLESVEARVTARRLMARLPRRERSVVWLRYFCCLTQAEIAAKVGMSPTAVSRSLARSLRGLRDFSHEPGSRTTPGHETSAGVVIGDRGLRTAGRSGRVATRGR